MKKIIYYFALLVVACVLTVLLNFPDWDLWARLAVGSIFFQTGWISYKDIFAYTPTKDLWIDHEWGSGVVFFFFIHYFGDWGLVALKVIILFTILLLISKTIKLYTGKNSNIELFYPIFIGFSILPGVQNIIRSHMFTFLFFALWVYVLERVRRGENRLLWILPVTMILWANMHGGFVVGLGLLFIYAFGEFLNNGKPLKYFIALGLALLATLINPYGIKYWPYIIQATTMDRALIPEWQPITLDGPVNVFLGIPVHAYLAFMIFALMTFIAGIKNFIKEHKIDWINVLLVLITFYFAMKHQRHAYFFVAAVSSVFYSQYSSIFSDLVDVVKNKIGDKPVWYLSIAKDSIVYVLVIALCVFVTRVVYDSPQRFVVQPNIYPVGSLEFIKQNNLSGNLAITYNWGSYALWKLYPQCKVLIDGRSEEVYPDDIIYLTAIFSEHLDNSWLRVADRFKSDIIIVPKRVYAPADLMNLKNWQMVYHDQISVLLLPKEKVRNDFIIPDYTNKIYWHENLSKHIKLK